MIVLLLLAVLSFIGMELFRRWLLQRVTPPPPSESFAGMCYPIGRATIAERSVQQPRATVVCMPGYCESVRYFTQAYADPTVQLILVSSGGYYTGLAGARCETAAWAHIPQAPVGSIEYDALVLNQALEHLPRSEQVRVHGHSRGGAVVLEAARLRPDLFQGVEVILEAPVLPQAKLLQPIPAFFYWLLPLLLPLWQRVPTPAQSLGRWGSMRSARKRELIATLPFNAEQAVILVTNLKSVVQWMQAQGVELYRNLDHGVILIPEDDQVLDATSMWASANQAGSRMRVLQIPDTSHFILLDAPDSLPPLKGEVVAGQAPQLGET